MNKYIEVKLTEDQADYLGQLLLTEKLGLEILVKENKPGYEFRKQQLAFAQRIRTKIRNAKS